MRELVSGSKKQPREAHAVKDSTGRTVMSHLEIQCANLLLKAKSHLHDTLMKEDTNKETTITEEEFEDVLGKFKRKNKKSYFFLIKSGKEFQKFVYKLCKRMINGECFPQDFSLKTLYQLWKRKGSKEDLNNHRYIHMKEWLSRLT